MLAYYSIGFSKYSLNNFQEAIKDCDRALEIGLEIFEAYYIRGLCIIKLGEIEDGLQRFNLIRTAGR